MTDFGVGTIRAMLALVNKIDKAGLQLEFQNQILDLQKQFLEMQAELSDTRKQNERLQEEVALRQMEYRDGMYWDGDDGPFCPNCVDSTKIRARVALNRSNGYYICEVCHRSPIGTFRE